MVYIYITDSGVGSKFKMERHALSGALLDTERAPSNIRALFILFKMLGGGGGGGGPPAPGWGGGEGVGGRTCP